MVKNKESIFSFAVSAKCFDKSFKYFLQNF